MPAFQALSRNSHFFEERHGYCANILGANSESRGGHYHISREHCRKKAARVEFESFPGSQG